MSEVSKIVRRSAPSCGDSSPWGQIDHAEKLGPDVVSVSTPSHGGLWVSPEALQKIPEPWRSGAWYEEDCDWAIAYVWLELEQWETDDRRASMRQTALESLRNWHPEAYERYTGTVVQPADSIVRAEKVFREQTRDAYVVVSASGDWMEGVPKGMVHCTATRGGKSGEKRDFLVPQPEYAARGRHGFVIDLLRHVEIRPK